MFIKIGVGDLSERYDSGDVYSGESLSVSLLFYFINFAFFWRTTYF